MAVLLLAAGGTIASRATPEGVRSVLTGAELVERAELAGGGIDVVDIAHGASWSLAPEGAVAIARAAVGAATAGRHEGVVVTHGTDTLEETAFLAWLIGGAAASERCPIVVTGAMRHDGHEDADGPANLRDAVELARAGGRPGPIVHLGGTSLHARWATKSDTSALDTFRAVGAGSPSPPAPPPSHGDDVEAHVVQVQSHTGASAGVLDWHLGHGALGIVVEGTGSGNVHGELVPAVERALAAAVPVVVTSRCSTGPVSATYGGPGGGRQLAELGCIAAGDLPTHKARVALAVALGADPAVDAVRSWFDQLVGGW